MKALDALNEELFQMKMADKETVLDWGVCLSRHLQILVVSFPDHFLPNHVAELKRDHFNGGLQTTESDGGLPQGGTSGKNVFQLP